MEKTFEYCLFWYPVMDDFGPVSIMSQDILWDASALTIQSLSA